MIQTVLFEVEDDVLVKVAKTFDKTPECLNQEVKELVDWIKTQPHLPEIMNEKMVQNFYIFNKCRMEKTKERIDNYYTVRSTDLFENINPRLERMEIFSKAAFYLPIPKLTKDMYRVFFYAMRDKDMMELSSPYDGLRHFINTMEVRLHEDVTFGDVLVADAKNVGLKFFAKLTPMYLYKMFVTIYEKVFSLRLKAVYVINTPKVMEIIVDLAKKLAPKLTDRFHVCKDESILHKVLPKEILPKDYGGQEKSLEELNEILKQKFVEYRDRFDALDKLRVNENLRPSKSKNKNLE